MTTRQQAEADFDAVALEYDFISEIFHLPDLFLEQRPAGTGRALDLGCGSGILLQALAPHYAQVVGVDLSQDLLAIAQNKRRTPNALFCQMDIAQLGLTGRFDYIVSVNVLHHIADVPALVAQLMDLLAPGGRLLLTDVTSPRPTPPTWVYVVGAVQEYLPNWRRYGWHTAQRVFHFRISDHWLAHLAADRYLSAEAFAQQFHDLLPGCEVLGAGCVRWDKPSTE